MSTDLGTPRISFARPVFRSIPGGLALILACGRELSCRRLARGSVTRTSLFNPTTVTSAHACFFMRRRIGERASASYPGCPRAYTRLCLACDETEARKGLGHPYEPFNPTAVTSAHACFFICRRIGERARPAAAYEKRHLAVSFVTVVGLNRLELSTSRLSGACSNQLSYNPVAGASLAGVVEMHGFEPRTS